LINENAEEHDLSVPVIIELQKLEGDDVLVKDVDEGMNSVRNEGRYITLSNGATYNLYPSYDDMQEEAEARVKQDLEENPEIFNQDFLQQHLTIGEFDRGELASDLAESRLEGVEDEVAQEVEDEVRNDLSDKEDRDNFEELVDDEVQKRLEKALDNKRSEIIEELEEKLEDDPVGFLVDEEGLWSREDLLKQSFIQIDIDEAVESAIEEDGVEHFISSYDGESHETTDDQYLVKHND